MAGCQHACAERSDPVQASALAATRRRGFAESRGHQAARLEAAESGVDGSGRDGPPRPALDRTGDIQPGREVPGADAKHRVEQELFEFPQVTAFHNPTTVVNIAASWTV